ncbi:hypothetical protein KIW84_041676 [Lathyrus oleraceus]|uniref:porphobilinogen synthase n=1 Tax=Pisum sativum TaxID=3888 RepID=A0A9D5ARY9_PEA|nr:hypothetical protein KIW84_041676 [Pisum sativum]
MKVRRIPLLGRCLDATDALKTPTGDEAYDGDGLVPRSIRLLKDKYLDLIIYTYVALDPYSSDGHDGIVREDGVIMDDETVHQLCKQAVAQARAGADVVRPNDMMDGRCADVLETGFKAFSSSKRRQPPCLFTVRASDSNFKAAVVAGKVPEAPPVPPTPASPPGTPVVPSLLIQRCPRRNRRSPALRLAFQGTTLSPANFVHPLFIHEGEEDTPVGAIPGCYRFGWRHGLLEDVAKARDVGVNSVVLFPKIPDALKTLTGDEAYDGDGLVPRFIRLLKDKYLDLIIYTDVALDPYSSDGHDGIVREDGVIMDDETVHHLCKQAVAQARAGADVVSPSDMMDARVGAMRVTPDAGGF